MGNSGRKCEKFGNPKEVEFPEGLDTFAALKCVEMEIEKIKMKEKYRDNPNYKFNYKIYLKNKSKQKFIVFWIYYTNTNKQETKRHYLFPLEFPYDVEDSETRSLGSDTNWYEEVQTEIKYQKKIRNHYDCQSHVFSFDIQFLNHKEEDVSYSQVSTSMVKIINIQIYYQDIKIKSRKRYYVKYLKYICSNEQEINELP
jgi:hypothetical protein